MTAIALVCDYSLRYLGGAQSAFLDQARILAERGHAVTIVAPDAEHLPNLPLPITVRTVGTIPGLGLPVIRNTAKLREQLRGEFRDRGIRVVHVHSEFGLTSAAIDVATTLGIPTAQTVHTFFWQVRASRLVSRLAAPLVRAYARWISGHAASDRDLAERPLDSALRAITLSTAKKVDIVISPSQHQADALRAAGVGHIRVIENAVPGGGSTRGAPLRAVQRPLRIVWVGRLVDEKRILEFIEGVRLAEATLGVGALDVDVIGEGPREAQARERASRSSSIRFSGRLARAEVRDRMRHAHLIALTSWGFDNQPVVVVEAFSEARSVLYVDPALTEGLAAGGILTNSPDPEGIAAALISLARAPEQVVAASHRAHQAADIFDPDRHERLLREAYLAAGLSAE